MSLSNRRVVITGIGVLTSIGNDAASFWDALARGQCGIRRYQTFDPSDLTTQIAGEVNGFDAKKYLSKEVRKQIKSMARAIQFAVAAAQLAMDDAKTDKSKLDPTRFGVEFGAGLIPSELQDLGEASYVSTSAATHPVDTKIWGEKLRETIQPLWMLKYLPNMLACHVSIIHNAQGPSNSITEGDAGSLLALGEATRILRRNQADFFLVGGADSKMNPLSVVRQEIFGLLSKSNAEPEKALKPFDARRDGLVLGEGGCVLAVEDLEHAEKRGATIYSEIVGFGSAFDRGLTGKGLARAVRAALDQAKIKPSDVDHVNAHGLGSVKLDAFEARGINEVFGTSVPVWAVKPYIGSLSAGSGTTDLAASLLAMKNGVLPPTLNYESPDPACPVCVLTKSRPIEKPYFVKLCFTEMGQSAAVVCRKWS
jgi:3-oxoacyl-[acyl-carrier-protein] synthase II